MASAIGSGIIVYFTLCWISSRISAFCWVIAGSFQKFSKAFIWKRGHILAFITVSNCLLLRLLDSLPNVLLAFARESWVTSNSLNNSVSSSLYSGVKSSSSLACVAISLALGRSPSGMISSSLYSQSSVCGISAIHEVSLIKFRTMSTFALPSWVLFQ